MSYYEELPLYRTWADVVVSIGVIHGLSRYHKYTLGTRLRHTQLLLPRLARPPAASEGRTG